MSFLCLKQGASASWYEANHALVLLSPFSSADGADSSHLFYAILSDQDKPAQDFSEALEEPLPRTK